MIKLVHTSDVHIGSKLNWLGDKSDVQKQQVMYTFEKVVDFAIEKHADVFLVAGDLFDTYTPNSVSIAFVKTLFEKLTAHNIFIALIPGNHDRLEENSVYKDNVLFDTKSGFAFTQPGNNVFNIPALGLNIFGYAVDKQFSKEHPLTELGEFFKKYERARYNIALVHGSLKINKSSAENYPVETSEIADSSFDYIALGDWHSTLDVTNVKSAWYCGSPELVGRSQLDCGNILYVEIDEKGTHVQKIKIGKRKEQEIKIDVEKFGKDIEQSIIKELGLYSNLNLILSVEFVGKRGAFEAFNLDSIKSLLADKFFFLEFKDCTSIKISQEDLEKYPETSLVGRYIKIVNKELEEANDEAEKLILQEALFEGIHRILSST